jgi:hypothetical protein
MFLQSSMSGEAVLALARVCGCLSAVGYYRCWPGKAANGVIHTVRFHGWIRSACLLGLVYIIPYRIIDFKSISTIVMLVSTHW